MLNSDQWIRDAAGQLAEANIPSARLDAEIILAHTIHRSRTWLHAHGDEPLDDRRIEIANARLDLRLDRVPIAYIIGHKEFYTRLFKVSPATLIPRPESEVAIALLKQLLPSGPHRLVDVGTGSGCIGISAKLELPELSVTLADVSTQALAVARDNAAFLGASIDTVHSDLLDSIPGVFDVIVANLPYVDSSWERSPETNHEPNLALFADDNGLKLIFQLIDQAPDHLTPKGLLLLEADPCQHQAIIDYSLARGFTQHTIDDYYVVVQKSV